MQTDACISAGYKKPGYKISASSTNVAVYPLDTLVIESLLGPTERLSVAPATPRSLRSLVVFAVHAVRRLSRRCDDVQGSIYGYAYSRHQISRPIRRAYATLRLRCSQGLRPHAQVLTRLGLSLGRS